METHCIPTKWVILTGAPCAGKTTLLVELKRRGFPTCCEAAEQYVHSQRHHGRSTAEIVADRYALIREITRLALDQEAILAADEQIFLDRSSFDTVAYCSAFGFSEIPFYLEICQRRYAAVYLLERLSLLEDRLEDDQCARLVESALHSEYVRAGYTVIRVPVLPVERRATFILEHLQGRE